MENEYDYAKFNEVLEISKEYLLKLNTEKRLKIIKKLLKNPNFDDTDIYYLCEYEFQKPTYNPPEKPPSVEPKERPCVVEHKEPLKIQFVMSGKEPIKPIKEQNKLVHKSEKLGQKRPRESESESDWEFNDEEEKGWPKKKKKKEVHNGVVVLEDASELPAEFKERIQNLGGSNAMLVIRKKLFETDVNPNHTRLSLSWKQIKDMRFLREEERAFLNTRQSGDRVALMKLRIIGENGSEHGICIRQWNMRTSQLYNLVTRWNNVVKHQKLCAGMTVEIWSFRVEGNLCFALVKL